MKKKFFLFILLIIVFAGGYFSLNLLIKERDSFKFLGLKGSEQKFQEKGNLKNSGESEKNKEAETGKDISPEELDKMIEDSLDPSNYFGESCVKGKTSLDSGKINGVAQENEEKVVYLEFENPEATSTYEVKKIKITEQTLAVELIIDDEHNVLDKKMIEENAVKEGDAVVVSSFNFSSEEKTPEAMLVKIIKTAKQYDE